MSICELIHETGQALKTRVDRPWTEKAMPREFWAWSCRGASGFAFAGTGPIRFTGADETPVV